MKKKTKKLWNILAMILGIIVSIAIGGAFISGMFLNVVILSWLPLIIHQVVGWIIIVGTIVGFLYNLFG